MVTALRIALPWAAGLATLVLLDLLWIGMAASAFYRSQIGHLLHIVDDNMAVNVPAAVATWAVIVTGIQIFVVYRTPSTSALLTVVLWGALFGAVVYAVYDLTNYAVLKDWTFAVTAVDILWGAFVCAATACSMAATQRLLLRLFAA